VPASVTGHACWLKPAHACSPGTGKTTLLRALAARQIKGIPANCQILHVEQEACLDQALSHGTGHNMWLCMQLPTHAMDTAAPV